MRPYDAPVLALDVDGVLLDYVAGLVAFIRATGVATACEADEMMDWMMSDLLPDATPEERRAFLVSFAVSESFGDIAPLTGALAGLAELRTRHPELRIVAITSAGSDEATARLRRASLVPLGIDDVTMLPHGASKHDHILALPEGSVLVDDLLKNVLDAERAGRRGILFRAPYNVTDVAKTAVQGWPELVEVLDTHFTLELARADLPTLDLAQ